MPFHFHPEPPMSLINWIFDIYQHSRIDKAHAEAAQARADLAVLRTGGGGGVDAARLQGVLEELALSLKALQRTLLEKGVCTPDELAQKVRQIDLEDGLADGRSRLS
jgi:hypothetical protein